MRWKDINYLFHGLEVIVISDEAEWDPGFAGRPSPSLTHHRGVIECRSHDDYPVLLVNNDRRTFYQAAVLIVPPRGA